MKKPYTFLTCAIVAVLATVLSLTSPADAGTSTDHDIKADPSDEYELLVRRVAELWGQSSIWAPSPTLWIQYEADLGERSRVDFEHGTIQVQLLVDQSEDAFGEPVLDHLRQGVRNLIKGEAEDPVELVILEERKKNPSSSSGNSKKPYTSHDLTLGYERASSNRAPLLLDQIRYPDGSKVAYDEVADFAEKVVNVKAVRKKSIVGGDGIRRQAVTVTFSLAPNHLEIRAKKYFPLVKMSADKHHLDPSLIMGIIHTESMFNPRARSRTPAFGLMQLVPGTGGREAYAELFGSWETPSPKFLYDPENNIELGVAYFDILQNRYMKMIEDPASRTYCAVAAYNAGASNVGRAFVPHKSIKKASAVINSLQPQEVYEHLVDKLHLEETRLYTKKVLTRSVAYSTWD